MKDPVQELDISDTGVVTKYKSAAEICNQVLDTVVDDCKVGAKLADIAKKGDDLIEEMCSKIFKGKPIEKGIAFPTCLSVDNCVGHYSPLQEDTKELVQGSVLKIDLGVHIDGYIAVQAATLVVQSEEGEAVTGKVADAIQCANTCFEAALRLIRPGNMISDAAGPLNSIAEEYGCSLLEGVLTHNMKQFVIDGNKCILNKPSPEQKVEDSLINENEVYAIDIVVSTGDGKARVLDEKQTSVFKRALNTEYNLKMKTSRAVLSEVNRKYPCMPFPVRKLFMEGASSKFGLVECLHHGLLQPYPVLWEREGETVAQVKGTVLLLPNGSHKITSQVSQKVSSDIEISNPAIKELLATSTKKKKASRRRKGGGQADAAKDAS